MKKEIYSFNTQENEFEIAYNNIERLIGHIDDFKGDLRAIKQLVDKYTLNSFLLLKRFKKGENGIDYVFENENGKILVLLNDFGDKIENILTHKKTDNIMELAMLVAELSYYKDNGNER